MGNFKIVTFVEPGKNTNKYRTNVADTASGQTEDTSLIVWIEFAVNDQLSVSITEEDFSRIHKTMAATASTNTRNTVTSSQTTIMAAYNIGGATIGLSLIDTDNSDYTDSRDETKSILSLALAF